MARSSKLTVARRVDEVSQIILLGAEFRDVQTYAKQKKWDCSDSMLYRYMQRAFEVFVAQTEKDKEKLVSKHLRQLNVIYQRALEGNDLRVARAVLQDIAQLRGYYPGSLRELQDQLDELKGKVHAHGGKRTHSQGPGSPHIVNGNNGAGRGTGTIAERVSPVPSD
jgi:hypothetical protein